MSRNGLPLLLALAFLCANGELFARAKRMKGVPKSLNRLSIADSEQRQAKETIKKWAKDEIYRVKIKAEGPDSEASYKITARASIFCDTGVPEKKPEEVKSEETRSITKLASLSMGQKDKSAMIAFTGKELIDGVSGGKGSFLLDEVEGDCRSSRNADFGMEITIRRKDGTKVGSGYFLETHLGEPGWKSFTKTDPANRVQFKVMAREARNDDNRPPAPPRRNSKPRRSARGTG
ncbi:MAG: hypothetical protein V1495_04105 [Pseudomonadota bacterium]